MIISVLLTCQLQKSGFILGYGYRNRNLTPPVIAAVSRGSGPQALLRGRPAHKVQRDATASPDDVWKAINAGHAEKHEFTMMLVLQKHSRAPGAEWVVLRLEQAAG